MRTYVGFVDKFFGLFDFFRIFWIFQDFLDFSGFFGSFRIYFEFFRIFQNFDTLIAKYNAAIRKEGGSPRQLRSLVLVGGTSIQGLPRISPSKRALGSFVD